MCPSSVPCKLDDAGRAPWAGLSWRLPEGLDDDANLQRKVPQSEGFVVPLEKCRRGARTARLWQAKGGFRRLSRQFPPGSSAR